MLSFPVLSRNMHQNPHAKRRKKRIFQGTKTVTVVRGKVGYGFTISGQNPCMLSCIVPGSPAEAAGLKPGDLLYVVNGLNVSKACHDDVVRMVGLSTGALELQVSKRVDFCKRIVVTQIIFFFSTFQEHDIS